MALPFDTKYFTVSSEQAFDPEYVQARNDKELEVKGVAHETDAVELQKTQEETFQKLSGRMAADLHTQIQFFGEKGDGKDKDDEQEQEHEQGRDR